MKNRTINSRFIFDKWDVEKLDFAQIASLDIPSSVCLKRIRNIVYGGIGRCKSDWQREVYKRFRLKFLEVQDVAEAIEWVHDNQPTIRISERTVYRVINDCLKENVL